MIFAGREIHLNSRALYWHKRVGGGHWTVAIMFWPPRVQYQFMLDEFGSLLRNGDWQSDEFMREAKRLHEIGEQRYWVWPDWFGHLRCNKRTTP